MKIEMIKLLMKYEEELWCDTLIQRSNNFVLKTAPETVFLCAFIVKSMSTVLRFILQF